MLLYESYTIDEIYLGNSFVQKTIFPHSVLFER